MGRRSPSVAAVQVEASLGGGERVADVLLTSRSGNRMAVEIQFAGLTLDSYLERTRSYASLGITVVWLWGNCGPHSPRIGHVSALHQLAVRDARPLLWVNPADEVIAWAHARRPAVPSGTSSAHRSHHEDYCPTTTATTSASATSTTSTSAPPGSSRPAGASSALERATARTTSPSTRSCTAPPSSNAQLPQTPPQLREERPGNGDPPNGPPSASGTGNTAKPPGPRPPRANRDAGGAGFLSTQCCGPPAST